MTEHARMAESMHIVCPACTAVNRVPTARLAQQPNCGQCHEPLFAGHPTALTTETFRKHIERNDIPVVVDFWAAWCGPCKMMAPHFEQAAQELEPSFRLAKVDTEAEPMLAQQFDIRGIPTLVVFRQGREFARQSGAMGAADLVRWIRGSGG